MGVFREIVVFGAPGTGKTLLFKALRALNDDSSCPYYFVTIDEPTQRADIAKLLAAVYQETVSDIDAGYSKALLVQRLIANARADACSDLMSSELPTALCTADKQNKTVVVVSDGHLLTDAKIYVRRRADLRQIGEAELLEFSAYRESLLASMSAPLAKPSVFCHMLIDNDVDGTKHLHRVCTLRANETERGVPAAEFAEFARYANAAYKELAEDSIANKAMHQMSRIDTDNKTPEAVLQEFLALVAATDPQ